MESPIEPEPMELSLSPYGITTQNSGPTKLVGGRRSTRNKGNTPSTRSNSAEQTPNRGLSKSTSRETPEGDVYDGPTPEATPSKRRGGLRRGLKPREPKIDYTAEMMKPLKESERQAWKGWAELESDPALFNHILRKYGVKDVKVAEVFGLDDMSLADLDKPLYGLIFLFQWKTEDEEEIEDVPKCPKHIWFANQTITNACATIAMLNIVMNVPEIDLGDNLRAFKAETQKLKPPYRGQRLGQNDFIRNNHNSFLRRMDILNSDLSLSNEFDKWKRSQTQKKQPTRKRTKKDDDENGFHFIAYVPINGEVWKLDGLQRQPVSIGTYKGDWMLMARDNVQQRIFQYGEDGIRFNLLALCKSARDTIPEKLVQNIKLVVYTSALLDGESDSWREFILDHGLDLQPNESYGITKALIDDTLMPDSPQLEAAGEDMQKLMDLYQDLVREQNKLKNGFADDAGVVEKLAEERKHDYTPLIYNTIRTLAEMEALQDIVQKVRDEEEILQEAIRKAQGGEE